MLNVFSFTHTVTVLAECQLPRQLCENGHPVCHALQNKSSVGLVVKSISCTVNLTEFDDSSMCYQWGKQVSQDMSSRSLHFIYLLRTTSRSVELHYYGSVAGATSSCNSQHDLLDFMVDNSNCYSAAMGISNVTSHGELDCSSTITVTADFNDNKITMNVNDVNFLIDSNASFIQCSEVVSRRKFDVALV